MALLGSCRMRTVTSTPLLTKDDMAVMLGGRMAEKIVFGEITTGASNDLEKATELARRMIMD